MNMHRRDPAFDCSQNITIKKLRKAMRQTALDADFSGSDLPGFGSFFRDLLQRERVSIRFTRSAAEGAEFASDETDICEIYVPIDNVSDQVADQVSAQRVGSNQQSQQIIALGVG
jgi:hypothetical protein